MAHIFVKKRSNLATLTTNIYERALCSLLPAAGKCNKSADANDIPRH